MLHEAGQGASVVLPEDEEAATLRQVTGWVSRQGAFFGNDERAARYAGATHIRCQRCGAIIEKYWLMCEACRSRREAAKFQERETREWDGVQMIYAQAFDQYYETPEDAFDAAECRDVSPADALLVLCEPVYVRHIEPDYFSDELPDEGELPDDVADAIDKFNEAIKGIVLSWTPGKFALRLETL